MRFIRLVSACCALAWLLRAPVASAAPFEVESFRPSPQHPLLLLAPRDSSRSTLTLVFDVGVVDDNPERGLTRLSQYILLHANARAPYDKLSLALYRAAATLEMYTGPHESRFTLTCAPEDFDALAQTLLTALLSPKPDARRFKATMERAQHDPQPMQDGDSLELLLARALIEDPRYADPNLGSVRDVGDVEPQHILDHLAHALAPRNATVIATGRFNAKNLRALVEGVQGGIPLRHERPKLKLPYTRQFPAAREVQLFAYPLNIQTASHAAAARVLASLMQERLYNRFRSAGVGYGFAAEPVLTPVLDVFSLILPATEKSGLDLGRFLHEEILAVSEGKLEPGSFERHQQATLQRLRLADTDPRQVAEELRLMRHRPTWYGPPLEAALTSLTPEALAGMASEWFRDTSSIHLHFVVAPVQPPPPPRTSRPSTYRRYQEAR